MPEPVNQEINVTLNALVKRIQDVRDFVALIKQIREQRNGPVIIDEKISTNARNSTNDVNQLAASVDRLNQTLSAIDEKQPTRLSNALKLLSSVVQGLAAAGDAVDFVKSWIPGFEKVKEKGSEAFGAVKGQAGSLAIAARGTAGEVFTSLRSVLGQVLGSLRGVAAGAGEAGAAIGAAGGTAVVATGGILALVAAVLALAAGFTLLIATIGAFTAGLVSLGTFALVPLLKHGADYNAQLEQTKLGIATVIASLAEFRDEAGKKIEGPEELNASLTLAGDQLKKLKVDAINTIATFEQISPAFQSALGPGLTAGLDLDQIRKLTVQIVQAAGAIGLPMNQVAQEVRAILDGTINEDARLAKILGISNELVKKWKEQGTLADELNKRLSSFTVAGVLAANTMDGLTSNLEEAVNVFSGQATERSFETLKTRIASILNQIFDFKNADLTTPFKNLANFIDNLFVRAIDLAGDFADQVVEGAKQIADWIQRNRASLDQIIDTTGEILRIIGFVIAELFRVAARLLGNKSILDLINNSLSFTKGLVALIGATVLALADGFALVVRAITNQLNPALSITLAIANRIAQALGITLGSGSSVDPNLASDIGGSEGIFRKKLPDFTVPPPTKTSKNKGSKSQTPADTIESEFALRRALAESAFNLEKDLVDRLTDIYRTALDNRKIATEEYFRAIEKLRQREIDAEIKLNRELLTLAREKRDAEIKKIENDKGTTADQKAALKTNLENRFKTDTLQIEGRLKILTRAAGDLSREIEDGETAALRALDIQINAFLEKVDEANGRTAAAAAAAIDAEFRELLERVTIEQGENSPLVQLIKEFIQLQKDRARVKEIDEQLVPLGQQFDIDRLEIETRISKEQITQKQGRRELIALEREYLKAQLENLKTQLATTNEAKKQLEIKLRIAQIEKQLADLKEIDETARSINQNLRTAFEDFFASVFDKTKSLKEAFADLGRSILQMFARLAAQRLVEKLFGTLLGDKDGQGGIGGIFTGVFGGRKAAGDMMSARPGGQLIQVAEAGFDELVVTTDPKYAPRTSALLGAFIRRTGILPDLERFAAGGFAHSFASRFATIPRLAAGAFVPAGPEAALAGLTGSSTEPARPPKVVIAVGQDEIANASMSSAGEKVWLFHFNNNRRALGFG